MELSRALSFFENISSVTHNLRPSSSAIMEMIPSPNDATKPNSGLTASSLYDSRNRSYCISLELIRFGFQK
jgi:hypothetical protein